MIPIQDVSDADVVFSTRVDHLMPKWTDIPEEFRRGDTRWNRLFSDWFYSGLTNATFMPKPGVDQGRARRHIKAIMGSFEPKHEHKEAAIAYLLSEWFEDVTYEKAAVTR